MLWEQQFPPPPQTKCNVLIDTGAMKSCMSQAYYQQLMLPATRTLHSCNIKSANGTNLCPIGIIEGEFKIGTKEYKNDFIVCKNLVRPCILGADFPQGNTAYGPDEVLLERSN